MVSKQILEIFFPPVIEDKPTEGIINDHHDIKLEHFMKGEHVTVLKTNKSRKATRLNETAP